MRRWWFVLDGIEKRWLGAGAAALVAFGVFAAATQAQPKTSEPECTDTECTVVVTLPRPAPIVSPSPSPYPVPGPTVTVPAPTVTVTRTVEPWRLVWSDEFDGDALDIAYWTARREGRDFAQFASCDVPENVEVAGGELRLYARRQNATCAGSQRLYTTGAVWTSGKFSIGPYGALEVRAWAPMPTEATSRGLWPAIWTRATKGYGEIDLMEAMGSAARWNQVVTAMHHDYSKTGADRMIEAIRPFPGGGWPGSGWHTYRVEWSPEETVWFVNGREIWRVHRSDRPWYTDALDNPHEIRLSFQIAGRDMTRWLGDPAQNPALDQVGESVVFRIDYVRVWSR